MKTVSSVVRRVSWFALLVTVSAVAVFAQETALGVKLSISMPAGASALIDQKVQVAATQAEPTTSAPTASVVTITLLHLNDVYEMTPVSGGKEGGLARVATLRKDLLRQNPHTYTMLAGDLLSPSALGTAMVQGERLAGRHMVAVMNALGLDYMTFGNHEFDLPKAQLEARLDESRFTWVSSNVFTADKQPFPRVAPHQIFTVTDGQHAVVRIGLFGLTLTSDRSPYVSYVDLLEAAKKQVELLRDHVDILIALTHLPVEQDLQLVDALPQLDAVLGGHEHEHLYLRRGPRATPIAKADANARTVYVHQLRYDTQRHQLYIDSRLHAITDVILLDPDVEQQIQQWVKIAFDAFKQQGFDPEAVVASVPFALDGLEASVRNRPTPLTELIADSLLHVSPGAELAIFNSGSIRVDDTLPPGNVTEYDVLRILPFGGTVASVEMRGSLLQRVLEQGRNNQGSGGYLQTAGVSVSSTVMPWMINGVSLDPSRTYQVAINDFLLTGHEARLDFLTRQHPELRVIKEHGDIRRALIEHLKHKFGAR
ncbi:MAG: bifunctional metallophosphatase/5'-nucleotidase [Candidatus Entotheonellia bacterium]